MWEQARPGLDAGDLTQQFARLRSQSCTPQLCWLKTPCHLTKYRLFAAQRDILGSNPPFSASQSSVFRILLFSCENNPPRQLSSRVARKEPHNCRTPHLM
jgi:hypothetical protein